jgi:hypothetical protein
MNTATRATIASLAASATIVGGVLLAGLSAQAATPAPSPSTSVTPDATTGADVSDGDGETADGPDAQDATGAPEVGETADDPSAPETPDASDGDGETAEDGK